MEIREATAEDFSAIVNLLKLSLGESLMPKSERYWKWKHLDNPFGPSPVLLCFEGTLLIGVRAFMRWEWTQKGIVYQSVRAVDTATHPDFQGKGIFTKLTRSLVDRCKESGVQFVFNTPNDQSRPGYLKMGWEIAGSLPIHVSVQRPLSVLKHIISNKKVNAPIDNRPGKVNDLDSPKLKDLIDDYLKGTDPIVTNVSIPFLKWRYEEVPVAQYETIVDERNGQLNGLIVVRIKNSRLGKELRITDCLLRKGNDGAALNALLKKRKSEWGIDYTTLSGSAANYPGKILAGLAFKAAIGPKVTIRPLRLTALDALKDFKQWSPSLGDLELF